MKQIVYLLIFIFISTALAQSDSDKILGVWLVEDKDAKVEIYKKNNKFYGKIVWLKEPNENGKPKLDKNNPNEKLQTRPLIGLLILKDFVYADDLEWEDGEIYDPGNGKTYSCNMELVDYNTLEVRGYIGISLFGRTDVWTRTKN